MLYDPAEVSYDSLLDVFWANHDPTTLNRQKGDTGTQYRSGIYTHSPEQAAAAAASKARAQSRFGAPIVTEVGGRQAGGRLTSLTSPLGGQVCCSWQEGIRTHAMQWLRTPSPAAVGGAGAVGMPASSPGVGVVCAMRVGGRQTQRPREARAARLAFACCRPLPSAALERPTAD